MPTKNSMGAVNLASCEDWYRIDALRGVGVQTEFQKRTALNRDRKTSDS